MRRLAYAALTLCALLMPTRAPALAAEPTTSEKDALTVSQVLNVLDGMSGLSPNDKDGRPLVGAYKLSGNVRILIARNMDMASRIQAQFQKANTQLVYDLAGGGNKVPDEKLGEYNKQFQAMLDAQSGVGFAKIDIPDLCLDVVPDKCPVANAIPPSVLSKLVPILR